MEYAHEVKNIVCEDCGKTCKKEADLGQHYLTKHKVYRCEECNVTFVGTAKLRRHLAFVHGKKHPKAPRVPGQCEECDFICSNKSELKNHIMNMHAPNDEKKPL